MNKVFGNLLSVALYLVAFILIQTLVQAVGIAIYSHVEGLQYLHVATGLAAGVHSRLLIILNVVSSLLAIALFIGFKWSPVSPHYLRTRPWGVLIWSVLLAFGTILPAEWFYEQLQIQMPENMEALFQGVMKEPWGYLAVGILAPVAEELVFRGAILRQLLTFFDRRMHWLPIALSALLFGAIHLNWAQGIHGFTIGLLLGWMYYRTHSVIPGILLHWINNTVAYVMFNLMPQLSDGKLIDFFHGSDRMMYGGLAFSFCILIPSLFQLALRMKR